IKKKKPQKNAVVFAKPNFERFVRLDTFFNLLKPKLTFQSENNYNKQEKVKREEEPFCVYYLLEMFSVL
ncbi:hypothetical protein ACPTIF_14050, partial [Enterococcus faecalis]|uniref:hypothetical protein n=1 Tax=Enterococcus faecalis TaxID=1351 RepID=UPI003CC529AC